MSFLWHSLALTAAHWLLIPSSLSNVQEVPLPSPVKVSVEGDARFDTGYVSGVSESVPVMQNDTASMAADLDHMMNGGQQQRPLIPTHHVKRVLTYKGLLFEASMKTDKIEEATHFHEQQIIPLEFDMGAEISLMLKDRSEADGITHISSISLWNVTGHGSMAEAQAHGGQMEYGGEQLRDAHDIHDRHELSPHVPWGEHDNLYNSFKVDYLYDDPDQGFFNVKWYMMEKVQSPNCWQPLKRLGKDLGQFYDALEEEEEGHHTHAEHAHKMGEAKLSHQQIMGMRGLVVTKVMQIFQPGQAHKGRDYFTQVMLPHCDSLQGLVSAGVLYDDDKLMVLYLWDSMEARALGQSTIVPDTTLHPFAPPAPAPGVATSKAPLLRQIVEHYEEAVWFWNAAVQEEFHPDLMDD